jgi:hypothetical protein
MAAKPKQRPEALAQFAETARTDQRKDRPGLIADDATRPIPTNSKAKDEAAAKVLREGATGEDLGSQEAIDKLPDRILDSRTPPGGEKEHDEESEWGLSGDGNYDATSDPRTGRPPLQIEAQALQKDRELERLRSAQLTEGEADIDEGEDDIGAEEDIEVTLEDDEMADSGLIGDQEPARMTSPGDAEGDGDEADDYGKSGR